MSETEPDAAAPRTPNGVPSGDQLRDRWGRIEVILDEALGLPAEELATYLDLTCRDDPVLKAEVEGLLAADRRAGDFMDSPAINDATTLIGAGGPEDAGDPLVGRRLGPYRVDRLIGGGGMGVVFEATDTRLDRTVALKLLPAALSKDPGAKERFVREARAASALDHPNICAVHDVGETEGGRMFIVMAYYAGETLADRLARGPLGFDEAREVARQIGRGLEHAHEAGIIHRDVKPANVVVTEDVQAAPGRIKILDFGIAQVTGEGLARLTQPGTAPGTPTYMSPEQSRGDPVDARTDVWSLSAVVYQMIAGRKPFEGKSEIAIYRAIQNDDPRPPATS